jgi:hypothetical protein
MHETAVSEALAAAGIGLTVGTNLFRGIVRPPAKNAAGETVIPDRAVFCLCTGGGEIQLFVDGGARKEDVITTVQIRIRSEIGAYEDGAALAQAVRGAIHLKTLPGYNDCQVREPEPIFIGPDSAGRFEWSLNVALWFSR